MMAIPKSIFHYSVVHLVHCGECLVFALIYRLLSTSVTVW